MERRFLWTTFRASLLAFYLVACGTVTGLSDNYTFTEDGGPGGGDANAPDAGDAKRRDGAGGEGGDTTEIGCSDGTRENFTDTNAFPQIAGCAGGWTVPGTVPTSDNGTPHCGRRAGNDGQFPNGSGSGDTQCSIEDLCSDGWHVCRAPTELVTRNALQCEGGAEGTFWLTRMATHEITANQCEPTTQSRDNIVGCGTIGQSIGSPTCGPLNRYMTDQECRSNSPWQCGDNGSTEEAAIVTKTGPSHGGVLCCKD